MANKEEFEEIDRLIGAYLNQDLHEFYGSVGEAVADKVRHSHTGDNNRLAEETALFESRYHNDLEAEFKRRYGFDFTPAANGQTVMEFFDMVRRIIADPENYAAFDTYARAAKK